MLHYIINTTLYDQRCVTWSTLHDIINAALYHQRCTRHQRCIISSTLIISSTQHYITNAAAMLINAAFYHQRCIVSSTQHYIINAAFYHQCCIISSMLLYIINAALYHQWCITLPMQNSITKCKVVYANFVHRLTLYINDLSKISHGLWCCLYSHLTFFL